MANYSFEGMVLVWLVLVNTVLFVLMYRDKQFAQKRKQRIPEKTLLLLGTFGGGLGGYLAMLLFRHKTKHLRFFFVYLTSIGLWSFITIQLFN